MIRAPVAKPIDIKIVGGGLAGLINALQIMERPHASGRPYDITIYEMAPEAYTTLCGEGISHKNLARFKAFDSFPYTSQSFPGAVWWYPGPRKIEINERCYTIERCDWIPAMAAEFQKRGGKYVTGKRIGADDIARMQYDVLIGADGPGSKVRAFIGGEVDVKLGIQYRIVDSNYKTDRLEFYTDKRWCSEYAWIFPKGDVLNVGILADTGNDWHRLDAFSKHYNVGGRVKVKEAYPIGFSGNMCQKGNIVLAGDAGGFTNPVTKGGIAAVILASEILADCIATDRLSDYQSRVFAHPIMDPSFKNAVKYLIDMDNDEMVRLARYLPTTLVFGEGSSRGRYLIPVLLTALLNPGKYKEIKTIYRAMSLSKDYSW